MSRIALITGSSSGIGKSLAKLLVEDGCTVVVTGRDENKLIQVVNECNTSTGGKAIAYAANLYDYDEIDRLFESIVKDLGNIDILVNNACYRGDNSEILSDDVLDEMDKVMTLNVSVPMYLIQKVAKLNKSRKQVEFNKTIVVNVSSVASQIVVPLHLYSISKACLSELTRQLATMSKELNMQFITVSPGPVLTEERPQHVQLAEQTIIGRVGTVNEIATMIMHAIEHPALFAGQELTIDGGCYAKQKYHKRSST